MGDLLPLGIRSPAVTKIFFFCDRLSYLTNSFTFSISYSIVVIAAVEPGTKTVTIPPEEGYGVWNETLAELMGIGSIPRESVMNSTMKMNKTMFTSSFPNVTIALGTTFDIGKDQYFGFGVEGIFNATIINVTDTNVTVKVSPKNGSTFVLPVFEINATVIVYNDTSYTLRFDTEVNHTFSVTAYFEHMHFKVVEVNEKKTKEFPLVLFTFDLLYLNGKDMTQKSYTERIRTLHKIIKEGFTIRKADRIITDKPEELEKFFEENIERGTEGIIAKRLDSTYQAGARNYNWIKLKRSYRGELQDTVDICVVGYFKGRGMRVRFGIGALLGCVYDEKKDEFKTIAKIGSGLSEEKWQEIRKLLDKIKTEKKPARVDSLIKPDVWIQPKYVLTVMADEITYSPIHTAGKINDKPGYALRFPRIQGWIRDKKPEDSTSVKEIEEMFKMQKHVKTSTYKGKEKGKKKKK